MMVNDATLDAHTLAQQISEYKNAASKPARGRRLGAFFGARKPASIPNTGDTTIPPAAVPPAIQPATDTTVVARVMAEKIAVVNELAQAKAEIRALNAQIADLQGDKETDLAAAAKQRQEVADLENRLAAAVAKLAADTDAEVERQVKERLQSEAEKLQAELDATRIKLYGKKAELQAERQKAAAARSDAAAKAADLKRAEDKATGLQNALEALGKEADEHEQKYIAEEQLAGQLRRELDAANKRLVALEGEFAELKREHDKVRAAHQDCEATIQSLRDAHDADLVALHQAQAETAAARQEALEATARADAANDQYMALAMNSISRTDHELAITELEATHQRHVAEMTDRLAASCADLEAKDRLTNALEVTVAQLRQQPEHPNRHGQVSDGICIAIEELAKGA